jgi:hypothetical protein
MLKKTFVGMMLAASLAAAAAGGSGIGGGMNFALISWCDDAAIMVREARSEALDRLNIEGDRIGALRVFYEGLVAAAASSENTEATPENSLTLRAITRGIKLSQLLGIPAVIGGRRTESGLAGALQIQGYLGYYAWYTNHIAEVASAVDRRHYIPYSTGNVGTRELEEELVEIALSQVGGLRTNFVRLRGDRSSFYTTVPAPQFLQALAYLAKETAADLNETLFASALECQSKLLLRLSRQVQSYLDGRQGPKDDAIRINRFVLELEHIIRQTESRTCRY